METQILTSACEGINQDKLMDIMQSYEYSRSNIFDENVFGDWFVKLQDVRNKSCVNIGQIQGAVSFKLDVDMPEMKLELLEYSEKHYNRILNLDKMKIVNYCRSQLKKNAQFNKYSKLELMNP